MSGLLSRFGKRHIELATRWMGSATAFGATAGLLVLYVTDFKTVLQYLPYYNGKYKEE
ncbi:hypothetical protein RN001_016089 [Aquatica leii]|uniref:Cytochrome b-c1 complex subunit 10 n=1 Tax=Aquatica leii TaxID=1421715 RepID=A0AAN7SN03_9COLE|nr:hypothetical protein RN001_016089 [Aquatica leii]